MLLNLKIGVMAATVGFLLGLATMFSFTNRDRHGDTLSPGLASVPTHTVTVSVKAQDKGVLRDAGIIGKGTEKNPDKEVLQTGQVNGSDGKKTVAAVLDTKTGETALTVDRPFAEFMLRHEVGIGIGVVDGNMAKAVQYRGTVARIWNFYGTVQLEAFNVDRIEDNTPWNAMAFLSYRW